MNDNKIVKKTVDLLDEFSSLYKHESGGRTDKYLEYVKLGKSDEKTLIQPTIFPAFLEEILDFSKVDYIPEERNKDEMAPDFTPIDTRLHPFIFETKGSNSSRKDLEKEYENKSKYYLVSDPYAKYAIITNMSYLLAFSKDSGDLEADYSFSFVKLYQLFKNKSLFTIKDPNVQNFLRFVRKFHKVELTTEKKIESIANAKPYPPLFDVIEKPEEQRETIKLTDSIRFIVNILKEDAKNNRGKSFILRTLQNDAMRREHIAREIYSICQTIDSRYKVPDSESIKDDELEKQLNSNDITLRNAIDIYFHRVAYFAMTRLLLIRAWEDAKFIEDDYVTLFNGGFKRWYQIYNHEIGMVLDQAFRIAKEKYEWLFTDKNNYAWYIPTERVLVDVLYELAKYNLSVLNRDILGTIYEEYLDIQDKKNKGQYYTPHQIVELIWDRLGFTSKGHGEESALFNHKNGKRIPKLIFDPATGSGGFLVEVARRIRNYIYFTRQNIKDLEDAKNAIVNGLYGSEISAFSYYITEVNLLLQLTPIIKKIVELEKSQRELGGKFTLGVIHQDSLKLHNRGHRKLDVGDEEVSYEMLDEDKDYDILKPEGEKLRVFSFIKDAANFDYCVANPPYIGEKGHKELFRRTVANIPYWKQFHQGKMDYLYWFVILGLSKLQNGGKLGFITSTYWKTADAANKLRKYILQNSKVLEMIDFGEIRLFEHAPGQHNIVFILEKASNETNKENRDNNRIKIVQVKKKFVGKNVSDTLTKLTNHIKANILKDEYSDDYIDVYYSPVKQGDLTDSAWYIFHTDIANEIIEQIKSSGEPSSKICEIKQGIVSGADKVTKKNIKLLREHDVSRYNIKIGDGIFVLTDSEVNDLNLNEKEKKAIKPFYKNSDIDRYHINYDLTKENIIYADKDFDLEKYPNIKKHLERFKPIIEQKRECLQGKLPWHSLHWSRDSKIFESEKIVTSRRSPTNIFAFENQKNYEQSDLMVIALKKDTLEDILYILGLLNSSLFTLWCSTQMKPKGKTREFYGTPLNNIPIKRINFNDITEKKRHNNIVSLVDKIIVDKKELAKYNKYYTDTRLTRLRDTEPTLEISKIPENLPQKDKRIIRTSNQLVVTNSQKNFILKKVDDVTLNLEKEESGFDHQIVLTGKDGTKIKIDGKENMLVYLKDVLNKKFMGKNWEEIEEKIILPKDFGTLEKETSRIRKKIEDIRERIKNNQEKIDDIVYDLYGINKRDVENALKSQFDL